jgi:thiol:disulfide interchange protein
MKCPDCGSELDENNICSNCRINVARQEQEIEIEYKEFPKSEFLEIRKKHKAETESAEIPAEKNHKKKKTPSNTAELKSASAKQSRSIKQKARETSRGINKKSLLIFLAGLLTAGILAGVYYLLKLFY